MLAHFCENKDGIASVEGTLGHILLEICVTVWKDPYNLSIDDIPVKVQQESYDWYKRIIKNPNNSEEVKQFAGKCFDQLFFCKFSDEMLLEINKCYQRLLTYRHDGWTIIPEGKVSLEAYFGHKHCDGTSDIIMFKGSHVIIADLKYGKGVEVSPINCGQLQLYSGGACSLLWNKYGLSVDKISIVIMQPRINNGVWKVWETNYYELYNFLMSSKELSIQALMVLSGKAPQVFNPSEKSCQFCHRKRNCNARAQHALSSVQQSFAEAGLSEGVLENVSNDVSAAVLASIMDRIPFITSFLKDVANEAQERARKGATVPNYKMVQGRSARKWPEGKDAQLLNSFVASGLLPTDCVITALKSPPQMNKLRLTKDQKKLVKDLTIFTHGSNVLVPDSDNRASITCDAAQKFKDSGL